MAKLLISAHFRSFPIIPLVDGVLGCRSGELLIQSHLVSFSLIPIVCAGRGCAGGSTLILAFPPQGDLCITHRGASRSLSNGGVQRGGAPLPGAWGCPPQAYRAGGWEELRPPGAVTQRSPQGRRDHPRLRGNDVGWPLHTTTVRADAATPQWAFVTKWRRAYRDARFPPARERRRMAAPYNHCKSWRSDAAMGVCHKVAKGLQGCALILTFSPQGRRDLQGYRMRGSGLRGNDEAGRRGGGGPLALAEGQADDDADGRHPRAQHQNEDAVETGVHLSA